MAVSLSGTAAASLFFEQGNSNSDQEGFLLGKVVSHLTDTISDSQLTHTKEETFTYIYSYLPCEGLFNWYDNSGQIVLDKLRQLLPGDAHKEVVGWYKFRRCSSLRVSLREHAIHQHLKEAFHGISLQHFLFCLCTVTTTPNNSTHSLNHIFQTFDGREFRPVPVTVVNLGDTAQSDYRLRSCTTTAPGGSTYASSVTQFVPVFMDGSGQMQSVVSTRNLNTHLHTELLELCHNVADSERALAALRSEVMALREQLKPLQPPPLPPSPHRAASAERKKKSTDLKKKTLPPEPPSDSSSEDEAMSPPLIDLGAEPMSVRDTAMVQQSNVDLLKGIDPSHLTTHMETTNHTMPKESVLESQQDLFKDSGADTDETMDSDGATGKPSGQTGDAFAFVEDIITQAKGPSLTRGQNKAATLQASSSMDSTEANGQQGLKFTRSNSMPRRGGRLTRSQKKVDNDGSGDDVKHKAKDTEQTMESDSPTF